MRSSVVDFGQCDAYQIDRRYRAMGQQVGELAAVLMEEICNRIPIRNHCERH